MPLKEYLLVEWNDKNKTSIKDILDRRLITEEDAFEKMVDSYRNYEGKDRYLTIIQTEYGW